MVLACVATRMTGVDFRFENVCGGVWRKRGRRHFPKSRALSEWEFGVYGLSGQQFIGDRVRNLFTAKNM